MATEHTRWSGRLRGPLTTLSRLGRLGDLPVVVMLVWAGWLAVPWSFSGLAQARAAAAAAAANTGPPPVRLPAPGIHQGPPAASPGSPGFTAHTGRLDPAADTGFPDPPAHTGPLGPAARAGSASPGPASVRHGVPAEFVRQGPAARAGWGIPTAAQGGQRLRTVLPAGDRPDAVASERARIAGEVHDAAGHGLAAIAMQAGLALVSLDDDPEQARASLRAIRETSTLALAQLRAALDGIDPPTGDLAGLIDGVRAAGLPVDIEPAGLAVPAHLQDVVYRVVRESLTNVLRHAGPTRALVRMGGDRREFVVEVADRGTGWTGSAEGLGLAGMRARVAEAGGWLTAGPREGGGFRVMAGFPRVQA